MWRMKQIATAVLFAVFVAGLAIVMIPSYLDIGLHWSLFVSRMNMYLPGLGMMLGAWIALAWLESK